ncbi:MAG: response regulator [Myxococcota bacterium]
MTTRLLVIDDEVHVLRSLARALRYRGAEVLTASDAKEALELLEEHEVHAVVTDHHLPPGPTGIWLLENVMHRFPSVGRILFSGKVVPHADELVRLGLVHQFLRKPVTANEVLEATRTTRASIRA